MVFIPPGTFRMGSPTNEVDRNPWEGPQTAVTISRGFWMGRYRGDRKGSIWREMGINQSYFNGDRTATGANYGADLSRPAEGAYSSEATNDCVRRSRSGSGRRGRPQPSSRSVRSNCL